MKVISFSQLNDWLDAISKKGELIAPVVSKDVLLYKSVESSKEISLEFEKTSIPPKNWYFPMTESILHIEQGKKTKVSEPPKPESVVVFGVRPCDARSVLAFDALFLKQTPVDRQYARHRQALTMIGLACSEMGETCFCTAVGGSPNSKEGFDILLTKVGEEFAIEILTKKGEEISNELKYEEKNLEIPAPIIHTNLPQLRNSQEWIDTFNDLYWKELSDRCLSCRACSFVCPTCRCYDVRDELTVIKPGLKEFERLRAWDTCTISGYRRIAGGHNPRETQEKRLRNRFFCKFMYYPEDFGPLGCVGCGRCIDACPVGIDILEVIEKVDSLLEKVPEGS